MKPVAVVTSHPIQYQTPLFRYLTEHGLPVHVFFLCDHGFAPRHDPGFARAVAWDIPLLRGFSHEFLPNLRRRAAPERFLGLLNPSLLLRVDGRFSAVVVHGYRSASVVAAVAAAVGRRVPVLYRSESKLVNGVADRRQRLLGQGLRRTVSACLSIGTLNDMFYEGLGIPEGRRFLVPYAVDNARFSAEADALSREEARREMGLPLDQTIVLFSGKLVPWKQPDVLLEVFSEVAGPDHRLVFAGDGPMRHHLQRRARDLPDNQVTFLGFQNQTEIRLAYRSADLLVLPSKREPWGLVVNEAMNFYLPSLVSDRVGCGPDLVVPGVTGDVFDHDDRGSLAKQLKLLMTDRRKLHEMGANARARIAGWGFEQCRDGLASALAATASG